VPEARTTCHTRSQSRHEWTGAGKSGLRKTVAIS